MYPQSSTVTETICCYVPKLGVVVAVVVVKKKRKTFWVKQQPIGVGGGR